MAALGFWWTGHYVGYHLKNPVGRHPQFRLGPNGGARGNCKAGHYLQHIAGRRPAPTHPMVHRLRRAPAAFRVPSKAQELQQRRPDPEPSPSSHRQHCHAAEAPSRQTVILLGDVCSIGIAGCLTPQDPLHLIPPSPPLFASPLDPSLVRPRIPTRPPFLPIIIFLSLPYIPPSVPPHPTPCPPQAPHPFPQPAQL